ncbi:TonB-dependent receptor [Phenylobacterium sp.]|uniref:TonB-dependent receptor n=1 Tax=Phenylobacterium sp. TaxID=1871053 RepID=UPI002F9409A4
MGAIPKVRHLTSLAGGAALSLLACLRAEAAEPRFRLSIPPKPYADALIDLGLQAQVSIVGVEACGVAGQAGLRGAYTLSAALTRLTAGAPCTFRIVDPRTVRIGTRAPEPAVSEPVRPTTLVGEVLVTATKRPALVGSLPAGVSVIPQGQIELTGAADPSQTTAQVAGVLTTNLGPGRDKFLVRGISDGAFTGRARSTVSTYLDDTPINYNAPDPALRLVDVDRIEVLRGPQGALYGSGAISGIYRIVTRKPELGRLGGGAAGLVAATDGGDPSYEAEGYVNVPLLSDRAALRLVGYHEVQGGYLDDVNLRISNVDRVLREGGRVALRLDLSPAWRVDLSAMGQHLRSSDTQYTTATQTRDQRANRVREAHKNDFAQAGLTVSGELGEVGLSSSLAFVRHIFASHYDASAALVNLGFSDQGVAIYIDRAAVDMWVQDLVLRSLGTGRFSWLAGVYLADTDEHTPGTFRHQVSGAATLATIYSEARHSRLSELALYGEGSWAFAPGWSASLGGRLFENRVRTSSQIVAVAPFASRASDNSRRFRGLSPKLSVQRTFDNGDLVYALYSEGHRPGGFNSSGFFPIRPSRLEFNPDRLRNYEVGAKLRLLDRRLGVRAAVYYDLWDDIQTDQYRAVGLSYTANVGDARILGLEAEVGYDFDFGLSLQANVMLANSDLTRVNPDFPLVNAAAPPMPIIDELPGVPKSSGGLLAIYERGLPRGLTLRLAGEAGYVGASVQSFNAALPTASGNYVNAKLSAEVASEAWSAGLFISNPANEAGNTFAYGNPFSLSQVRQVTPQRPRTIGLRLAAAF